MAPFEIKTYFLTLSHPGATTVSPNQWLSGAKSELNSCNKQTNKPNNQAHNAIEVARNYENVYGNVMICLLLDTFRWILRKGDFYA